MWYLLSSLLLFVAFMYVCLYMYTIQDVKMCASIFECFHWNEWMNGCMCCMCVYLCLCVFRSLALLQDGLLSKPRLPKCQLFPSHITDALAMHHTLFASINVLGSRRAATERTHAATISHSTKNESLVKSRHWLWHRCRIYYMFLHSLFLFSYTTKVEWRIPANASSQRMLFHSTLCIVKLSFISFHWQMRVNALRIPLFLQLFFTLHLIVPSFFPHRSPVIQFNYHNSDLPFNTITKLKQYPMLWM